MEEKTIIVSIVRDLSDYTLLVIREESNVALLHANRTRDFFPVDMKHIGENDVQCAIRSTCEQTGIVMHNPKEVARIKIKLEMEDDEKSYEVVVFLSTGFAGSLHPVTGTTVLWQKEDDVKANGQLAGCVLQKVLAGKYVRGTYNYSNDEFVATEVRII